MESTGIVHFDWTMLFQIANSVLLGVIVYTVVRFVKRIMENRRETNERLERIEEKLKTMDHRK